MNTILLIIKSTTVIPNIRKKWFAKEAKVTENLRSEYNKCKSNKVTNLFLKV